jgi:hypothetical protein
MAGKSWALLQPNKEKQMIDDRDPLSDASYIVAIHHIDEGPAVGAILGREPSSDPVGDLRKQIQDMDNVIHAMREKLFDLTGDLNDCTLLTVRFEGMSEVALALEKNILSNASEEVLEHAMEHLMTGFSVFLAANNLIPLPLCGQDADEGVPVRALN